MRRRLASRDRDGSTVTRGARLDGRHRAPEGSRPEEERQARRPDRGQPEETHDGDRPSTVVASGPGGQGRGSPESKGQRQREHREAHRLLLRCEHPHPAEPQVGPGRERDRHDDDHGDHGACRGTPLTSRHVPQQAHRRRHLRHGRDGPGESGSEADDGRHGEQEVNVAGPQVAHGDDRQERPQAPERGLGPLEEPGAGRGATGGEGEEERVPAEDLERRQEHEERRRVEVRAKHPEPRVRVRVGEDEGVPVDARVPGHEPAGRGGEGDAEHEVGDRHEEREPEDEPPARGQRVAIATNPRGELAAQASRTSPRRHRLHPSECTSTRRPADLLGKGRRSSLRGPTPPHALRRCGSTVTKVPVRCDLWPGMAGVTWRGHRSVCHMRSTQ